MRRGIIAASAAAVWTPSSLFSTEFGDFWDAADPSRMFQNAAASTLVTATGDPLCGWVGQRDVITLTQAVTASGLLYDDTGYAHDPEDGVRRSIYNAALATTGSIKTQSVTVAASMKSGVPVFTNSSHSIGWSATLGPSGCGLQFNSSTRGVATSRTANTVANVTDAANVLRGMVCTVTGGTSGYVHTRSGGKVALTVGPLTGLGDTFGYDGSISAGAEYRIRRMLLIYRAVTDEEAANILTWLES